MRILPLTLTLALGLALAEPAAGADLSVDVGEDPGQAASQGGGAAGVAAPAPGPIVRPPLRPRLPKPGGLGKRGKGGKQPDSGITFRKFAPNEKDDDRRRRSHRRKRHPFFFPHFDDDDDDRIVLIPIPAPRPEPAEPEPAAPAPPPDPRGAAIKRARGAATEAPYTVGEPLPGDVPHVTLDWRRYELPEPPPGKIYARVGRAVLLIDAATRVVERRVEPGEPAPEEG